MYIPHKERAIRTNKPRRFDNDYPGHHAPEFHFPPPEVFTFSDKTIRRFTEAQVYKQAAQVIRAEWGISDHMAVFPPGTYTTRSKEPTYTLKEMSDKISKLVYNYRRY